MPRGDLSLSENRTGFRNLLFFLKNSSSISATQDSTWQMVLFLHPCCSLFISGLMECGSNQIPVIVACIKSHCSSERDPTATSFQFREENLMSNTAHAQTENVYMSLSHITEWVYMGLCIQWVTNGLFPLIGMFKRRWEARLYRPSTWHLIIYRVSAT